jgi:hypothetical protein
VLLRQGALQRVGTMQTPPRASAAAARAVVRT